MRNTDEIQVVDKALMLTTKLRQLNEELETKTERMEELKSESYKNPPAKPVRVIEPPITKPEIHYDKKFNRSSLAPSLMVCGIAFIIACKLNEILAAFVMFGTIFGWPFYAWKKYKKHTEQVQASKDAIANSSEYQKRCQRLEDSRTAKQQENDALYQKRLDEWNNIIMPKYNEDKQKWTQSHLSSISKWQNEIDVVSGKRYEAEQELEKLYAETKLIPIDYRNEKALSFIKQTLDTTDYDMKIAIEMYDRKLQMALDAIKIQEQQRQNALLDAQNELLDEQNAHAYMQNELLYQQNEIAEKARKEAKVAAAVSAVQRHNTNKYLKR